MNLNPPNIESTPEQNSLEKLRQSGLSVPGGPIRLHVGCGENNLPDYINVDLPSSEQTILNSKLNAIGNMLKLGFPSGSVSEVRTHHVFEHFERPVALGLLAAWGTWLHVGGAVVIETPDFEAAARSIVARGFDAPASQIELRHIFGSHEARWAIHCDGWFESKFRRVLDGFGFSTVELIRNEWLDLKQITVVAQKQRELSSVQFSDFARKELGLSLVERCESELKLLDVWVAAFESTYRQMTIGHHDSSTLRA